MRRQEGQQQRSPQRRSQAGGVVAEAMTAPRMKERRKSLPPVWRNCVLPVVASDQVVAGGNTGEVGP